jgi:hypothetical protein
MTLLYRGLEADSTPAKAIGYSEAISFLLYAPVRIYYYLRSFNCAIRPHRLPLLLVLLQIEEK